MSELSNWLQDAVNSIEDDDVSFDLMAGVADLQSALETAEIIISRRDSKIERQAAWITRLETSRASLREALVEERA